jgi:dipeptidyl aminopeptidase/acylaminoacyl peptidase
MPPRPLDSSDLFRLAVVDEPQLSPDGMRLVWIKTVIDADHDRYLGYLQLTDLSTGETRALTHGPRRDSTPRWSPDGSRLLYLSTLYESNGVRELKVCNPLAEAERTLLPDAATVAECCWSPDGRRVAFTRSVTMPTGLAASPPVDLPVEWTELYRRYTDDVLLVTRMKWKLDGVGHIGDSYRQLALLTLPQAPHEMSGEVIPLTHGRFDVSAPSWSPDGRYLAVITNTDPDADSVRRQDVALVELVSADLGSITPQAIFRLEDIRDPHLAWSPDGTRLAVAGHDDPGIGHYGNQRLWLIDVATQQGRCLSRGLDLTLGNAAGTDISGSSGMSGVRWDPDGESLLALVSDRAQVRLCRFDIATSRHIPLTPEDHWIAAFSCDRRGERIAYLAWERLSPGDLYLYERSSSASSRVTRVNEAVLADIELSDPLAFSFDSEGERIDAWLIRPPRPEPGRRTPLILYPGGGPGGMRGGNFWFEYQLLAAHGYAVLYCNARGCQGYGETFCTAILGAWGGADYRDNLRAVDEALRRFAWLDPERLAIIGGSYGGYLVNWAIGSGNDFRCAIADRSITNRISSWGTSDIGHLREFEYGNAPPWEAPDAYVAQSPLARLVEARTPTLVVHSGLDLRCPIEQGEDLYFALKYLGVPTELVRFPHESHGLSRGGRPWHRLYRLEAYLGWLGRWLQHRDKADEVSASC